MLDKLGKLSSMRKPPRRARRSRPWRVLSSSTWVQCLSLWFELMAEPCVHAAGPFIDVTAHCEPIQCDCAEHHSFQPVWHLARGPNYQSVPRVCRMSVCSRRPLTLIRLDGLLSSSQIHPSARRIKHQAPNEDFLCTVFRPDQSSLPVIPPGTPVLLRNVKVTTWKRQAQRSNVQQRGECVGDANQWTGVE